MTKKDSKGTPSNVGAADPKKDVGIAAPSKDDKDDKKDEEKVPEKKTLSPEFVKAKIEKIKKSKMPDWQKEKYIRKLMPQTKDANLISFAVYVKLKKIPADISEAMKSYPPAKGMESATFEQWDDVYKKF